MIDPVRKISKWKRQTTSRVSFDSEVVEVGDAAAVPAAPVHPPDVVVDGAARGEEGVGAARAAVHLAPHVRLAHVALRQGTTTWEGQVGHTLADGVTL